MAGLCRVPLQLLVCYVHVAINYQLCTKPQYHTVRAQCEAEQCDNTELQLSHMVMLHDWPMWHVLPNIGVFSQIKRCAANQRTQRNLQEEAASVSNGYR